MEDENEVILNSKDPQVQLVLGHSLGLVQKSGLREVLLEDFGEVLVDQILDATCIQFLNYIVNEEKMEANEVGEKLTLDLADKHRDFFTMALAFYSNENPACKHPVSISDLDFGPQYDSDMDVIKFVIQLLNKHGVSDKVYRTVDGNTDLQMQKVLSYAIGYIQGCSEEDGSLSIIDILLKQHIIGNILASIGTVERNKKGDSTNG